MNPLLVKDEENQYASLLSEQRQKSAPISANQLSDEEKSYSLVINQSVETKQEALRQSLMSSVNKNPDQVAQIQKLAAQSNLHQETVERNLAVVIS